MNGWDDSCVKSGKTSGQILADNIRRCVAIAMKVDPGKSIVVWNDMFDPYHNARKQDDEGNPFTMYMTKGTWWGSWEGLTPGVGIVNWSGGKTDSYQNFAKSGRQQIISGNKPDKIVTWLETCKNLQGVAGVMYTTWENDFGTNMVNYVEAVKQ